jgi:pyruvate,water dikinase|tara:strand:- start:2663 stop:3469 length:807 start_codon:yes stop_codon:yes gene_type:complete
MTYLGNSKGFIVKNQTKHAYTIGGKAEQLNNISRNLMPDYVVIPTEVGDYELSEAISDAVKSLTADFKAFANPKHRYAVRSSAVREDGDSQSYAGIFESKLNVPITGLEVAVRDVRDCVNAGRVHAYDVLKSADMTPNDVAVIIMDMVDAQYSGVLFSKEPVDGTDRMLVEYEEGVGGVVDGESDSHMLFLDSRNFHLSEKNLPYLSGKSTFSMDSPIHHKALKTIWEEAKRLENNYRKPVDIEWAIDKEGKPWVLQVRPITAMKETA